MNTHKIGFYEKINKIISELSSNVAGKTLSLLSRDSAQLRSLSCCIFQPVSSHSNLMCCLS